MEVDRPPLVGEPHKVPSPPRNSESFWGWVKSWLNEEFLPFWNTLRLPGFWLTLLVSLAILVLAYQFSFTKIIKLDLSDDKPYLIDYYAAEHYESTLYRWTQPSSNIRLPNTGQMPRVEATILVFARSGNLPVPTIKFFVNSHPIGTFQPIKPNNDYQINYNAEDRSVFNNAESEINIWMLMDPLLVKGDPRPLGVAIGAIKVEGKGLFDTGRPVIPDWGGLALAMGTLALLYVLGQRAGWRARYTSFGIIALAILIAAGLILDRPTTALALPLLWEATLLTYPLAVVCIRFTGWRLSKSGLKLEISGQRWLVVIFVVAFIIRAVGINHPSFQVLDHGFRIHEVAAIKQDPGVIFSRYYNINTYESVGSQEGRAVEAGQWGIKVALPYTPLFYLVDQPIAYLVGTDDPPLLHATNLFGIWFDVSAIFFLYLIARRTMGRYGQIAGLTGAVFFTFFPVAFLMVSDGGYNPMLAMWLTLAWLSALTTWICPANETPQPPGWKTVTAHGLLLALTFLSHTATFLILGTMAAVFFVLLLTWDGGKLRYLAGRYVAMSLIGLAVSMVTYYGFYVYALITNTIPTILDEMSKGKTINKSDSVIEFWPLIWGHFHFVPFVIGLLLAIWLVVTDRWGGRFNKKLLYPKRIRAEINAGAVALFLAWFITFGLFSLLATKINLLQKHMLFAQPLLALLLGLALAMLLDYVKFRVEEIKMVAPVQPWPRFALWAGWLVVGATLSWFVAAGAYTWFIRSIHYVLPTGTG